MAACFRTRKDAAKLEAAELLVGMLDQLRGSCAPGTATYKAVGSLKAGWQLDVGVGLVQVFGSKLGAQLRATALKLAALTIEWHGIAWTVAPTSATKAKVKPPLADGELGATASDIDTTDPITLLALLVEVCTIEMRMALEDRSEVCIDILLCEFPALCVFLHPTDNMFVCVNARWRIVYRFVVASAWHSFILLLRPAVLHGF
jgi:hypothetical protein